MKESNLTLLPKRGEKYHTNISQIFSISIQSQIIVTQFNEKTTWYQKTSVVACRRIKLNMEYVVCISVKSSKYIYLLRSVNNNSKFIYRRTINIQLNPMDYLRPFKIITNHKFCFVKYSHYCISCNKYLFLGLLCSVISN